MIKMYLNLKMLVLFISSLLIYIKSSSSSLFDMDEIKLTPSSNSTNIMEHTTTSTNMITTMTTIDKSTIHNKTTYRNHSNIFQMNLEDLDYYKLGDINNYNEDDTYQSDDSGGNDDEFDSDESYRGLFEHLLSHLDMIMESTSPSSNESPTALYHIIIANSTTSFPMILVTTSHNDGKIHHLNSSSLKSSSKPKLSLQVPGTSRSIIDISSNDDRDSFEKDEENEDNSDESDQIEMIVMRPRKITKSLTSTNNSEQHSLTFIDHLPPGFLELIQSIYSNSQQNFSNDVAIHHHQNQQQQKQSSPPLYDETTKMLVASETSFNSNYNEQSSSSSLSSAITTAHANFNSPSSIPHYNNDDHRFRKILVIFAYSSIMIISLCGNYLVCHVIYFTPKLRTTTNTLIFSLTISDIMTTVLNIPFNCARFLLPDWPFPDSFCIMMPTLQVTSVYVSALTMAAICLHRYRSILGTTNPNITISSRIGFNHTACSITKIRIKMWILFIWFVSILLALPHTIFNVVVQSELPNGHIIRQCRAEYPKSIQEQMPLFLSLLATVTQFLLPLGMTTALYTRIGQIIAHQGKLAKHYCDELNRRVVEVKRKRIIMLVLIVVGFLVTWFPLTVYHLLIDFHLVHFDWNLFLALHIWAMTSVCYDSFIYCFMNDDFRMHSKQIISRRSLPLCFFLSSNRHHLNTRTPGNTKNIYSGLPRRNFCHSNKNENNNNDDQEIPDKNGTSSLRHTTSSDSFSLRTLNNQNKSTINSITLTQYDHGNNYEILTLK